MPGEAGLQPLGDTEQLGLVIGRLTERSKHPRRGLHGLQALALHVTDQPAAPPPA